MMYCIVIGSHKAHSFIPTKVWRVRGLAGEMQAAGQGLNWELES